MHGVPISSFTSAQSRLMAPRLHGKGGVPHEIPNAVLSFPQYSDVLASRNHAGTRPNNDEEWLLQTTREHVCSSERFAGGPGTWVSISPLCKSTSTLNKSGTLSKNEADTEVE